MLKVGDILICKDPSPGKNYSSQVLKVGTKVKVREVENSKKITVDFPNKEYAGTQIVDPNCFVLYAPSEFKDPKEGDIVECLGAVGRIIKIAESGDYKYLVKFDSTQHQIWFTLEGKLKPWFKKAVLKKI